MLALVIPAHAQWADVIPGLGPELSNANVGQVAVLSHVRVCAVELLPGLGSVFPNANAGQYACLSHSRSCAVGGCFTWTWT